MRVSPAAVWGALADAGAYGEWGVGCQRTRRAAASWAAGTAGGGVVGSKRIRAADPSWPEPGSRFHHTVGVGPLSLDDHTESLEAHPPTLLRMRAKARPFGTAQVRLGLT